MKKIRMLRVSFDTEIKFNEIPSFRSAIIYKVGQDNILFHHHVGETKYLYKYPLIQYKSIHAQPTIICIDSGVDEIHKYFEKRSWDIQLNGRQLEMKIANLQLNQMTVQVWNKKFPYQIYQWIGLNQENFKLYNDLSHYADKIQFMERILKGNILSFAKGIGWTVDQTIEVAITDLKSRHLQPLKGNPVMVFNLNFETNVSLPNYIGLGKAVSKGFGVIKNIKEYKDEPR